MEPRSPTLQADSLLAEPEGKASFKGGAKGHSVLRGSNRLLGAVVDFDPKETGTAT